MNIIPRCIRKSRVIACLMSLIIIAACLRPLTALADDSATKTVRVGYVNVVNYEEGGEGEYKRGAGYEYLQKISYITGWKYEYVYGTFTQCYQMLVDGEIDLFGNVSYTPERAQEIDFSTYPQGKDTYWLYTSRNRTDFADGDITKLNGCRIGATDGSYQETLLKQWLDDNGIQAEIVKCNGYDELLGGLDRGELDAVVAVDLALGYDYMSIVGIGFSEYYFGVSKSRPDILHEINSALYEIQNSETDYNNLLSSRYYYKTTGGLTLNTDEKEWLAAHYNIIKLGYISDMLPFSGEENGQLIGVLQALVSTLENEFGVTVETYAYQDRAQLKAALADGSIDIGGPVVNDFYLAEQDGCVLTQSIMDTTPVVIYKGDNASDGLKSIAVSDQGLFEGDDAHILFPDAQIVECDSQNDCLKAIWDGKAGSTIVSSAQLNLLRAYPLMEKLQFAEMTQKTEIGLMSSRPNRRAATIATKAIAMSSDVLSGVVLTQHSVGDVDMSLAEFIAEHAMFFVGLAGMIILALGLLIHRLRVSQKRLKSALSAAQSSSIAKTTFLSNMSHDIRTPMNAIIGFTNIAEKHNPEPEIQNCLEKIDESSNHLLTLINDVLDISAIESGKVTYHPMPVDITSITDTVLDIMNGFLSNREIRFDVKRAELEHPYVLADAPRIREVLVNVLSNAVKFTNDGGTITFDTDYHAGTDANHIVVIYRVRDTGVGMSEEFQKHIFDEFSQEASDARTHYKGTGLGMAISKRYVDMMGGNISVESQKGVGSTFTIEIPLELTEKAVAVTQNQPIAKHDLSGVKALLVEDNDLNAEIATVQLEECGLHVTRAADGLEAVDAFKNNPPGTYDLILMDIMMPRMNGYEATRNIRALSDRPDSKTIPIIAMTANAFAEDVQASLSAGMNDHLSKPIIMDEVIKTIARNLNRK